MLRYSWLNYPTLLAQESQYNIIVNIYKLDIPLNKYMDHSPVKMIHTGNENQHCTTPFTIRHNRQRQASTPTVTHLANIKWRQSREAISYRANIVLNADIARLNDILDAVLALPSDLLSPSISHTYQEINP